MEPSAEQKKKLETYWHKALIKFGLQHWYTEFKYTDKKNYIAQVQMQHNAVTLSLGPKFWAAAPALKRWTLTHEILHIWLHPLTELHQLLFAPWLPPAYAQAIQNATTDQEETLVDTLGRVVQELLPMWKD